jgi:hypothetical protein
MNTQEKNLGVNATLEEIEKELFEGDTIITGKKDLESMPTISNLSLESTD